jgi:hypothetical protein
MERDKYEEAIQMMKSLRYAWHLSEKEIDALALAIAALREKQQREKEAGRE